MRMEPSLKEKEKILKTDLVSINGLPAVTDRLKLLLYSFNEWVLKLITDLTSFTFLVFFKISTNYMSQ